jgi:hypothetical protein
MTRVELSLALREIRRIESLAWRFLSSRDDEEAFLVGLADTRAPASSFVADWFAGLSAKRLERPYGPAYRVMRPRISTSHPAVFFAVLLSDKEAVATFGPRECPEIGPFITHQAVTRLFSARGYRFPADLSKPLPAQAVWDLLWANPLPGFIPTQDWPPKDSEMLEQDSGALDVTGIWMANQRAGKLVLHWDARRLWMNLT